MLYFEIRSEKKFLIDWLIDWPALEYADADFLLNLPLQGFSNTSN